jgi:hypothetical protein
MMSPSRPTDSLSATCASFLSCLCGAVQLTLDWPRSHRTAIIADTQHPDSDATRRDLANDPRIGQCARPVVSDEAARMCRCGRVGCLLPKWESGSWSRWQASCAECGCRAPHGSAEFLLPRPDTAKSKRACRPVAGHIRRVGSVGDLGWACRKWIARRVVLDRPA